MTEIPFELQHLSRAHNYQQWITDAITPFLGNRILEVGAGIGNHSIWLPVHERLVLTEAEPSLFQELNSRVREKFGDDFRVGTKLVDLSKDWVGELASENFDTIVSFNVLEHIEDDEKAVAAFADILRRSQAAGVKRVVNFVPAHHWALGSIDQAYGHFRRYSHRRFFEIMDRQQLTPKVYYRYFNIVGLPGWWVMGKIVKKDHIGPKAVTNFERICPFIRGFDDFIHEKLRIPLGQSLLFVMEF